MRISRLKFAKLKEHFKNKPETELWKRLSIFVLKICKYKTIVCFTKLAKK